MISSTIVLGNLDQHLHRQLPLPPQLIHHPQSPRQVLRRHILHDYSLAISAQMHSTTNMANYHRYVVSRWEHDSTMILRRQVLHRCSLMECHHHHTLKSIIQRACRPSQKCWRQEKANDLRQCLSALFSSPLVHLQAEVEVSTDTMNKSHGS